LTLAVGVLTVKKILSLWTIFPIILKFAMPDPRQFDGDPVPILPHAAIKEFSYSGQNKWHIQFESDELMSSQNDFLGTIVIY
jgi:hypothetical protein